MLTPADIDSKRFSTTRLKEGYDQDEVDGFLDDVAEAYKVALAATARLENEVASLRRQAEYSTGAQTTVIPQPPSAVAERLLAAAEQAAKEHEADALAKADEVVREAGARGARIVEEASEAAERIKSEGLAEKYRRNEELEAKARRLDADVTALNGRGAAVRQALAEALASYDKEMFDAT